MSHSPYTNPPDNPEVATGGFHLSIQVEPAITVMKLYWNRVYRK